MRPRDVRFGNPKPSSRPGAVNYRDVRVDGTPVGVLYGVERSSTGRPTSFVYVGTSFTETRFASLSEARLALFTGAVRP